MEVERGLGEAAVFSSARIRLVRASRFHWVHWSVILLSFVLTLFAWRVSTYEHDRLVEHRFEAESRRVVDLIVDRMEKYEEALWGGVALIDTLGGDVTYPDWEIYATSLQIESRFPGINGFGVIHAVSENDLPAYLAKQQVLRPDYAIHPAHDGNEYYPISHIVPLKGNEQAVGLDMAHENNRFTAAKKARDTGWAQITGPITLVQDSEKTPGFLFFAPFYRGEKGSLVERQTTFGGMVYAPFVVKKLMEGVLSKEHRDVGVRIVDGEEVLYDENTEGQEFYDAKPLFEEIVTVPLYGRVWAIEIRSTSSFRQVYASNQPLTILFGGIVINIMLIALFVSLARTARRALHVADTMTEEVALRAKELEVLNKELERSNSELDDFAHIASHDLKEPLRGIKNYTAFLMEDYESVLDDAGRDKLSTLGSLAERLTVFIDELHQIARVGRESFNLKRCDTGELVQDILVTLGPWLDAQQATVTVAPAMPTTNCHPVYAGQVFRNLITNGVKYNDSSEKKIRVGWKDEGRGQAIFYVTDNGIGIREQHREKVFRIFKRLHGRDKYGGGSGAGLAVAKKIIERHNGRIWIESDVGSETTFYFTLNADIR